MSKKVSIAVVFVILSFVALTSAKSASAFCILDFIGDCQVKGDATTTAQPNEGLLQNVFRRFTTGRSTATVTPTPTVGAENQGTENDVISESRINELVNEGRITAADRATLLAKLAAIKAKREELRLMVLDLTIWLKSRRITPSVTPSESPEVSPRSTRGTTIRPSETPESTETPSTGLRD